MNCDQNKGLINQPNSASTNKPSRRAFCTNGDARSSHGMIVQQKVEYLFQNPAFFLYNGYEPDEPYISDINHIFQILLTIYY